MAYNSNIPQPADQIKNSQPQILANFQAINTALAINHVGFNDADQGKHKFIQFPEQLATPATGLTEYAMFAKEGLYSNQTELYFVPSNNQPKINITEKYLGATDGWYQLPSGIIVKYVKVTVPAGGPAVGINFDFIWPTANSIPFTQVPFSYNFSFFAGTNENTLFIANVDSVSTTNLRTYVRLCSSTGGAINYNQFDVVVTAYGI